MEYLPLNGDKDEIRFLTILSQVDSSDQVHYKLTPVSLKEFNPEYQGFVLMRDLPHGIDCAGMA
jgi:hypothetical protein